MTTGIYRDQTTAPAPDVLIVSGLDPSGGAGFLADARVVHMLGGRPVGAISTMTVQNTKGLRSAHEIDLDVLGAQLDAVLTDIEVKAVKIGMLVERDVLRVLDEAFALTNAPIVWDPIGAPTRGQVSYGRELLEQGLRVLGPHLTLITPNARELAILAGAEVNTLVEAVDAGKVLARASKVAVLVKGGHVETLAGARRAEADGVKYETPGVAGDGSSAEKAHESVDVLCTVDGGVEYFRGPRVATDDVHGTGCALSSAIATYLALGQPLGAACRSAKEFVAKRIASAVRPGQGAPAVL
ncbi:MAG: hydroxymethylpyrimidine/phosphomethylpyrimidine kinase [Kofleriaceae bacterium]